MSIVDRMHEALDSASRFNGRFGGKPSASFYLGAVEYHDFLRACRHIMVGEPEFCGFRVWQVNIKNHFVLAVDANS